MNNTIKKFKQKIVKNQSGGLIQKYQNSGQLIYNGKEVKYDPNIKRYYIDSDNQRTKQWLNKSMLRPLKQGLYNRAVSSGKITPYQAPWLQNTSKDPLESDIILQQMTNPTTNKTTSTNQQSSKLPSFVSEFLNKKAKENGGWTSNSWGNGRYFQIGDTYYGDNGNAYDSKGNIVYSSKQLVSDLRKKQSVRPRNSRIRSQNPVVEQSVQQPTITYSVGDLTYQNANDALKQAARQSVQQPVQQEPTVINPGNETLGYQLNSRNIRANRNKYSNVNQYWDYLNTDEGRNSKDYRLWQNIMRTQDGNLNREVFDEIMNRYGIRGNLGRRDSGRLANLLNTLGEIGREGSATRSAFVDSYNQNFDNSQKQTQFFKNQNFGLTTPQFITYTPSSDFTKNLTMLNIPLKYNMKFKKGGLISKNPVERFKINFR